MHRVVVQGYRAYQLNKTAVASAKKAGMEGGIREQYLPAKYNTKSTLEMTVDAKERRVVRDFDLVK